MTEAPFDPQTLAETASTLARMAGEVVRSLRASGVNVADTKSSPIDVVTAADRESERLLTEELLARRPHDGILGEEGASVRGVSPITWVVDPIDGTVNYLYDLPGYAVSVAATVEDSGPLATVDGRRAVAGAVYLPSSDEMFTAWEGGGAFLNGAPLQGPPEKPLESSLVATGFGYTVERRTEQAEVIRHLLPRVRDIRRLGAAAADLCFVAAGRFDAYFERGLQPWDFAAAALVARESGATLLGLDGEAPGTSMFIAAAPGTAVALHAEISEAYRELG